LDEGSEGAGLFSFVSFVSPFFAELVDEERDEAEVEFLLSVT
jgi:hypothetical protein